MWSVCMVISAPHFTFPVPALSGTDHPLTTDSQFILQTIRYAAAAAATVAVSPNLCLLVKEKCFPKYSNGCFPEKKEKSNDKPGSKGA